MRGVGVFPRSNPQRPQAVSGARASCRQRTDRFPLNPTLGESPMAFYMLDMEGENERGRRENKSGLGHRSSVQLVRQLREVSLLPRRKMRESRDNEITSVSVLFFVFLFFKFLSFLFSVRKHNEGRDANLRLDTNVNRHT